MILFVYKKKASFVHKEIQNPRYWQFWQIAFQTGNFSNLSIIKSDIEVEENIYLIILIHFYSINLY